MVFRVLNYLVCCMFLLMCGLWIMSKVLGDKLFVIEVSKFVFLVFGLLVGSLSLIICLFVNNDMVWVVFNSEF